MVGALRDAAWVIPLVVLNVVLGVFAWSHVRGEDVLPDSTARDHQSPGLVSSPSPEPEEASPPVAEVEAPPVTGYAVAVVGDSLLVRAAVSACEPGVTATVEVSEDVGGSFAEYDVPLAVVTKLTATAERGLVVVGADDGCVPAAVRSGDAGVSWEPVEVAEAGWSNATAGRLFGPSGEVTRAGCAVADVSGSSAVNAVALCEDGRLLRTENGGSFWGEQATLPNATGLAFTSSTVGYALVTREDCEAMVRTTTDGGATWRDLACVPAGSPAGLAAEAGGHVVVIEGAQTHRTTDRGLSWQVS
jgi:hypothetical protein